MDSCASRHFHVKVLWIHLKTVSRKYNGKKKTRVLKHLKRLGKLTYNKLLLPNYSLFFKAFSLYQRQNSWNTTKHTESCCILSLIYNVIIDSKFLKTNICLVVSLKWYHFILISSSQVLLRHQQKVKLSLNIHCNRFHHSWMHDTHDCMTRLHPVFSQ